jgi:hypothetical protein
MSNDPDLIKKLREATLASEKWTESMKKLYEIRQKADAYFSNHDKPKTVSTDTSASASEK